MDRGGSLIYVRISRHILVFVDILRGISSAVILVQEFYSSLDTDMGYVTNATES